MIDGIGGTEMDLLAEAAGGMRRQRMLLDLSARNIAAAQASSPGHPYARLVADFAAAPGDGAGDVADGEPADDDTATTPDDGSDIAGRLEAGAPLPAIRTELGSGDALTEMIAVLDAQRAYEQHASVFDIGKRLAERTIDLERG